MYYATFFFVTVSACMLLTGNAFAAAKVPPEAVELAPLVAPFAAIAWIFWRTKGPVTPDLHRVGYATNRRKEGDGYGSSLAEKLEYGVCTVAIPKAHKFGSVGSSAIVRFWKRLRTGSDDRLYIVNRMEWVEKGFILATKKQLAKSGDDIFLYTHGYNVSFDDAILRAAQIGFDLKIRGATVAFCWASRGEMTAYASDEDTVKISERHLAEFLSILHSSFPGKKIHILAHSMGNRALLGVLENLIRYSSLSTARFGQIFLAAPDVDARYFKMVASVYLRVSDRTTLYVSARDKALAASKFLHEDPRAGHAPPVTVVPGIDTVVCTDISLDFLGHGYFANAFNVLYDMYILMLKGESPSVRPTLVLTKSEDGLVYWTLRPT
jgi:esterase/lipase superfamily enzyme